MNLYIILTELKQLYRNHWLLMLTSLIFFIFLYAAWNGNTNVEKRKESITSALVEMDQQDELLLQRLDSLKEGHELNLRPWQYPDQPTATGNFNPRVAAFYPSNLALISTGQSDLFIHYVKPTLNDDVISLSFAELTSPVRLLFGNFDISFVLIYLLPLIVIAFCYNILSIEKESGLLRLVASNPLNVQLWLFQKTLVRFITVALLIVGALCISLALNKVDFQPGAWKLLLSVILYASFWFALSFVVNLFGRSSEYNAITLLSLWMFLVLILPSTVSQIASELYPVPSRVMLVNELRKEQAAADKEQDKILDDYLRAHPEMVVSRESDESTAYGWWQRYFASKDLVEQRIEPLMADYDQKLLEQQMLVRKLRYLSPSVILQDVLSELAHTSTDHYLAYKESVFQFTKDWKSFFLPLVFAEKEFSSDMVEKLPQFQLDASSLESRYFTNMWVLFLYPFILIVLCLVGKPFSIKNMF